MRGQSAQAHRPSRPDRGAPGAAAPFVPNALERVLLDRPRTALALLSLLFLFFAYQAQHFRLDASADSLLLDEDPDLHRLRDITQRYGTRDLLVVTFTPAADLFSDASLRRLADLRAELRGVAGVESVTTILDVPLLGTSDVPLSQLAADVPTLERASVDRARARKELVESPVFRDLVISRDARTTALLLTLEGDRELSARLEQRNRLRSLSRDGGLPPAERERLEAVERAYEIARARHDSRRHAQIADVRAILERYRNDASVHLGGVPMIADDMISFVRSDLIVFGSGAFVFLVGVLAAIFRQPRWVALPLLSCIYAGVTMLGLLGLIGWKVTVVSSNFLALMLIMTISMNIHLAVRYRQLARERPHESQKGLVALTLRKMVWPCLYTALTTMIGFSSLAFSDIKPVQDFGWMMSIGLGVTFATSFMLFPALLALLARPGRDFEQVAESRLPGRLAVFTERHGTAILVSAGILVVASGFGISRLTVENSFIDYFSEDTEIHRGMRLIDEELGGTTPLEILVHMNPSSAGEEGTSEEATNEEEFEDWLEQESGPEYWFTPLRIEKVKRVHDYLESLPEVGKVLSIASVIRVAEMANDGDALDSLELAVLYRKLPASVREGLVDPYFSPEQDEARIQLRILDSRPGLRRAALLDRIESDVRSRLEFEENEVTVAGTLVLYNNMLQSLFGSQISSLGAVLSGVAVTFLVLFRSVRLAAIGIAPNLIAAGAVLGLMGLAGIPLDIMTITIAAITIGIAVDNSIHYLYRFREEYAERGDYVEALHASHRSIGLAVLYTSAIIIFGFSILVLSNFLPTIYFGAGTGLALLIALLAALTLLPKLILLSKPLR